MSALSATKKLLLAAMLVGAPSAWAQNAEQPVEGGTPPSQEAGRPQLDTAGEGHEGEKAEPEDKDPSRHFNFTNFSWRGKDEYGGEFGDGKEVTPDGQKVEEEPMSPPFIFMLINFGLLLIILGKYLWPEARKLAEERHEQIKTALDQAAQLRHQAEQKLSEYESRIKDVDAEIKKLVDGIRADAEADKARILEAASKQAAQMKKDAEQRIAAEIELARAQLTKEVTAAATGATERLLKEKTTPDDQRKLVSSFIEGIH
jgi:F0F1-type ATP synthase membrane subunit b/b'